MYKNSTLFMFFWSVILLCTVTSFASVSVPTIRSKDMTVTLWKPNGQLQVDVFREGKWQRVERLQFDQFFRESHLTLSPVFISEDGTLKIRVSYPGQTAAHIDSVFINNLAPVAVKGVANGLKKISQQNLDVIDISGKSVELTYTGIEGRIDLRIVARIENERISEAAFYFPVPKEQPSLSQEQYFYSYRLNSETTEPFFQEITRPASGHPMAPIYGWVENDEQTLRVKLDFVSDNTRDGGKDYATLHVKTDKGVRQFRVSENEKVWGTPFFTYTDKAVYQHKVYAFEIPLSELTKGEDELLLAFSAYGTAAAAGDVAGQITTIINGESVAVAGATVTLTDPVNGYYFATDISDLNGEYNFMNVPAFPLLFTVEKTGLTSLTANLTLGASAGHYEISPIMATKGDINADNLVGLEESIHALQVAAGAGIPADGTPCEDGDACTTNDVYSGGVCGGAVLNCDDSNVCTDDTCSSATGCLYTDNTAPCDDGDVCSQVDVCSSGTCVGGSLMVCDDMDMCNGAESCDPQAGCVAGSLLSCDDGNECTEDSCESMMGCLNDPSVFEGSPCEDGDICTEGDMCQGGACVGGGASGMPECM